MNPFLVVSLLAWTLLLPTLVRGQETDAPARERPRYQIVVDKARPANEIQSTYPYDIPLRTADGEVLNSAQVLKRNGKPTVLLFWLTTCIPCRYELEAIRKKFEDWRRRAEFNFYAISTDFEKNFPQFVKRVREEQWPFEAYHDMHREFRRIMPGELNGLPQVFLLDARGNIVYHKRKYRSGDEDLLFAKILEWQ